MPKLRGRTDVLINAPVDKVYAVAADAENSPRWQPEIKTATVLERDAQGRQVRVSFDTDAKVKTVKSTVRFDYTEPTRIHWVQQSGDMAGIEGTWRFTEVSDSQTRAECEMELDLGRILGLAVRGPVADLLRKQLIESMPPKLKAYVEGA